jgi:hypothetical protein
MSSKQSDEDSATLNATAGLATEGLIEKTNDDSPKSTNLENAEETDQKVNCTLV